MLAARNGNPDAVKVLIEGGAKVNVRESVRGTTALMWAAEQKHPEAVKALLAGGADFNAKSAGAGLPRARAPIRGPGDERVSPRVPRLRGDGARIRPLT